MSAARILLAAGGDPRLAVTATAGLNADRDFASAIPAIEWSIEDNVLNIADSAAFSVANIDGENTGRFVPGQKIAIDISDDDVALGAWCRQFTGRVQSVRSSVDGNGGGVITVTAFDLGWHLTSCDARPLQNLNGITFETLLKELIDPSWGIDTSTVSDNTQNRTLKQGRAAVARFFSTELQKTTLPYIQVEPGQKPMDILRQYATREGLLINLSARGGLLLFRPNYISQSPYSEGVRFFSSKDDRRTQNNIVGRPSLTETLDGRYTECQCWSTVVAPDVVQTSAMFRPNDVYRHDSYVPKPPAVFFPLPFSRLSVFSDGEAMIQSMREHRARWKLQMDSFMSWQYECELPALQQGGAFFVSDSMISVQDGVHKIGTQLYVQSVRKSMTLQQGTRATLTLRLPGLLDPDLQFQPKGTLAGIARIAQTQKVTTSTGETVTVPGPTK